MKTELDNAILNVLGTIASINRTIDNLVNVSISNSARIKELEEKINNLTESKQGEKL